MKWAGKRSYSDKKLNGEGLSLKLGQSNIGMYFQFYSDNLNIKHYGRTK